MKLATTTTFVLIYYHLWTDSRIIRDYVTCTIETSLNNLSPRGISKFYFKFMALLIVFLSFSRLPCWCYQWYGINLQWHVVSSKIDENPSLGAYVTCWQNKVTPVAIEELPESDKTEKYKFHILKFLNIEAAGFYKTVKQKRQELFIYYSWSILLFLSVSLWFISSLSYWYSFLYLSSLSAVSCI
jgi:hypothetical protein